MKAEDWAGLWVLNELVEDPSLTLHLVECEKRQWNSRWEFPGNPILSLSRSMRLNLVKAKCKQGSIKLFDRPEEVLRRNIVDLKVDELLDEQILHCYAALTPVGFQVWEREFAPDWSRYWVMSTVSHASDGIPVEIHTVAGSVEMRSCLADHFCAFYGLPEQRFEYSAEAGFEYSLNVGAFKTIEFGYASSWRNVSSVPILNSEYVLERSKMDLNAHAAARKELLRLSGRWRSSEPKPENRRDTVAMPLDK